jgi:hypothetical protein
LFGVSDARGEEAENGEQQKTVVLDHGPLNERFVRALSIDAGWG